MSGANQCGLPVDYLVRHPHWQGDFYHVCEKHLEWAKRCVGKGDVLVIPTTTENGYRTVISGCVWWDSTKHPTPKNRLPLGNAVTSGDTFERENPP